MVETHIGQPPFINALNKASGHKVLIIEDNPGDARLVELFLIESDIEDCQIVNSTTLQGGMDLLSNDEDFAAIFLDLTLPDSSGIETLERLASRFPHNNIIVLTGLSDKSLGLKAVKIGAQDFLVKGEFDADELAKTLRFSIERNKILKKLDATQRIASIGNWEFSQKNGQFEASEEVYRMFRLEAKEENNHILLARLQSIHDETMKWGEVKQEIVINHGNDEISYAFVQCLLHHRESNKPEFQGIIQDITERRLTELENDENKERYKEIFTHSSDSLFISTLDGKIVDFNRATANLFGYSADDLRNIENLHGLYLPVESKNEFLLKLKIQKSVKDFELQILNKNGKTRVCRLTANLTEASGFTEYNCMLRDVTDQRQADELRKAKELADQSAKMKEQIMASISHEMRTPMNAILGMSNILLQMDMDAEQLGLVNSIKQSSEILLGVVNDILEVSQIQNGKYVFENVPFDLFEVLDNLINVMQHKAQEKDLILELIVSEGIPQFIKGDKLRLNQVLYNLVGNAIKFTDSGFVKIEVSKLFDIANSVQLKFTIKDSGIGIPEDKIDTVFETFTRIKQTGRIFEGTGLGLSICKNLVESQGGKIDAYSEMGQGSTFFFDLIFETASPIDFPENNDYKNETPLLPEETNFSLLMVEDHKMNQLVAQKTLERKWPNIQITIAENGQQAIEALKEKSFDLVLMDLQMPVMDGFQATEYIRKQFPPKKANMHILAMTAHAHISQDEKFKEYGLNDFVLKPFKPEDLFYKISKYVKI